MSVVVWNPVPTAGQLRTARARSARAWGPVASRMDVGVSFVLGLAVVVADIRRPRHPVPRDVNRAEGAGSLASGITAQGRLSARELAAAPVVIRTTEKAKDVVTELTLGAERFADEAHDSIEEISGALDAQLHRLRERLLP